MKQTFEEFIAIVEKRLARDPWVRDANISGFSEHIALEAKELLDATKANDIEQIKEELGDVIMNCVHACKLAEEQGLFTLRDVFQTANEKMKRRCPYVLDEEHKPLTKEEAVRLWKEAKKIEKEEAQRRKSQTLK